MDDEDHYRLNAFDWTEEFPEMFRRGGFDAVIGNPPYIFARGDSFSDHDKSYFYSKFKEQNYQLNTYTMFIELGIGLLRKEGWFGFITPNNWLTIGTLKPFRDYLISTVGNLDIVNYGYKVFDGANVDTATLTFQKKKPAQVRLFASQSQGQMKKVDTYPFRQLVGSEIIRFSSSSAAAALLTKMNKFKRLKDFATVRAGLMAYEVGKGDPIQTTAMKDQRIYHSTKKVNSSYRRYLDGKDVRRYQLDWSGGWLRYGKNLAAPRKAELYEGERILVRQIPNQPPYSIHATLTADDFVNDRNSMIVKVQDGINASAILAMLNSKLLSFWFNHTYQKLQRGIFPQFKVNELDEFPMAYTPETAKLSEKAGELLKLLSSRSALMNKVRDTRIKVLNDQIDQLTFEAFGLTADERELVSNAVLEDISPPE